MEKAKERGFDLNIFPANMTDFKSNRKYSCAIIARSGFMHLLTPQLNTKDTDCTFRLEYVNKQGKRERIYNAITYDPTTQIMGGNWMFETLDDAGNVLEERIRPVKQRQTYRQEMKYLLELCGFEIVNIFGGYHKESAEMVTRNVIWCVRKGKYRKLKDYS